MQESLSKCIDSGVSFSISLVHNSLFSLPLYQVQTINLLDSSLPSINSLVSTKFKFKFKIKHQATSRSTCRSCHGIMRFTLTQSKSIPQASFTHLLFPRGYITVHSEHKSLHFQATSANFLTPTGWQSTSLSWSQFTVLGSTPCFLCHVGPTMLPNMLLAGM